MTKNKNTGTVVIIAIALILLLWFVLPQFTKPIPTSLPSNVEYGEVNTQGQCVGRTGLSYVMCCGVWDSVTSSIKWVPCEDTIVDAPTQAMMRLGGGALSYQVNALMLGAKVNNTGNLDFNARLTAASSSIVTGGTAIADQKFDNAWLPIIGNSTRVNMGQTQYMSMTTCNPVILDIPAAYSVCGNTISGFVMPDGTYRQSITVTATGIADATQTSTSTTTVDVQITQEALGFSLEISQV